MLPSNIERAKVRALIYARVSREDPEHFSISLASQRATCERYATEHGWTVAATYEDVMTGSRDDRHAYQALLAAVRDARHEGVSVSVLVALDRLARRMVEALCCRAEFRALEVQKSRRSGR